MANRSLGTLTVDLLLRMGGFRQGADRAARESDALARRVRGSFNQLRGIIGTVFAGFSIAKVIQATSEAEAAFGQLKNAVQTNAGAAGKTADELANVASELQSVTTYGDEAIQQMQALLLRFKGIGETRFDDATRATLDLATALGTDLQSAARLVGLALDNPTEGLSRLSRVGIAFTNEQRKLIKSLVDSGRQAEAQGIILRELESRFGGAAEAARDTFAGALTGVRNAFGDLLEVKTGVPAATDAINEFARVLEDPQTKQAADNLFSGLIAGATFAVNAIRDLVGTTRWAAEELAATRFGPAAGDAVRIEKEIEKVRSALRNPSERLRFFGRNGIVEWWSEDELKAELKRLEGLLADYGQDIGRPAPERTGATPVAIDLPETAEPASTTRVKEELWVLRDQVILAERAWMELGDTVEESMSGIGDAISDANEETFQNLTQPVQMAAEAWSVYAEQGARNLQDSFARFLFDPFEDGLRGMAQGFIDTIRQMLAQYLAFQAFTGLGGALSGSSNAFLSSLGGFLSGRRATGGPMSAGGAYLVGENGPELVFPNTNSFVVPNHALGGVTVNYSIDARGADADRIMAIMPSMLKQSEQRTVARVQELISRGRLA